jgi:molybdopterin-containing oxidoreductase family membrane subunit
MATLSISKSRFSLSPGFLAWIAFLGLLLLIGLVSAYEVFTKGLIVTDMSNTVPWGLWITVDLSSIALGAGAFTLSAIIYLFRIKSLERIARLAVLVGIVGYTSALLALVMDIGRPDRFWHPWVFWNVHSVLWEITWCITLYLGVLLVEFAPVISDLPFFDRWPIIRRIGHTVHKAAPVLALVGLLISLLHQSSLGATYGIIKARPIWFKPSMPIMFIISAVAVGPALTMASAYIVEWVTGRRRIPHKVLRTIARFSGLALLVYTYIKFWDLAAVTYYGSTPGSNQALYILNQFTPYGFGFWVGEIVIGIVIPVILFLVPRFNRKPINLVIGSFFAAIGILANRWNVTVSGLIVPLDFSPGVEFQLDPGVYTPSLVEWGVVLGVIGYALLFFTLGVRFLPIFNNEETSSSS